MFLGIITILIVLLLITISISVYRRKHSEHPQTPVEIVATSIADKVTNVFNSTPSAPAIIRSEYFPDKLYVGKTLKLDSTLKLMLTNVLFGFPDSPLIVKEFKKFKIDDNTFEETVFDKIGAKDYIMLHDVYEETNYFLNRVMSQTVAPHQVPPMAEQDTIELTENEQTYVYEDFSGLIEVKVTDEKGFKNNRLIRVYSRDINEDDQEFLICIMDKPDVVHYYIGFHISIHQLEDL